MADQTDFSLTLTADAAPLQKAMTAATDSVKAAAEGMKASFAGLTGALDTLKGALVAFAAVAAGAGAFDAAIGATTKFTGEVSMLSKALGITTEDASGLNLALGRVGSDADTYTAALQKLTRQLRENEPALNAMGIATRDSNGQYLNGRDLMNSALGALRNYREGTDRNLAAQVAFGKGAADAAALLRLTTQVQEEATEKAKALGLVVGGDNVAAVKAFKVATNDVNDVLLAIEVVIGNAILPVLTKLANWFSDGGPAAVSVFKAVAGGIGGILGILADTFMELWDAAKDVLTEIGGLFKTESNESLSFADIVRNAFAIVAAVLLTGKAAFMVAFDTIRGAIEVTIETLRMFWNIAKAVFSWDFSGAAKAYTTGMAAIGDAVVKAGKRMYDDAMKTGQKISDALAGNLAKPSAGTKPPAGGDKEFHDPKGKKGRQEDTSKAEYEVAKANLEAIANLQKEMLKESQEADDDAYRHNLMSIQDYYADRIRIEQAGIQAEIDAKQLEVQANAAAQATAATDRERLTLKAAEIKLLGQLTVLHAQYSNVVTTNTRAMTDAESKRAAGLKEIQIASQVNIGNAQVAMDRIALDTRKQLRQTADAEAIQEEKGFEDRLTAIQAKAIQDRIALEKAGTNDPEKILALNAQLEELERQHQEKLTQLDAQATVERNKYATQAAAAVQDQFATFFDDLTDRTKKLSDTFKDLGKNLLKAFNDIQSKKLAEQLFGAGTSGGGLLNNLTSQLFPAAAIPAAKGAGGAVGGGANDVAGLAALDSAAQSTTSSMNLLSTSGIGGMFKSATDWIGKQISGTVATVQQATASDATSSAMTALSQAAYGAAQALQSVGMTSGGSGGSGGSGNIFGSMLGGAEDEDAMGSFLADIPAFADGTDRVPSDMVALVHAGERITPAKYNARTDRSSNVTLHQTVKVPPTTSRASAAQQFAKVAMASSAAISRNR